MADVLMIIGSFIKTDVYRIDVTAFFVGIGIALLILLWIVTKIKSNRIQKEFQKDKGNSKFKIIKVLLIVFPIIFISSFSSFIYFDSKLYDVSREVSGIDMCWATCDFSNKFFNDCFYEVNALDFESRMKQQCYRDYWDGCQSCRDSEKRILDPLKAEEIRLSNISQKIEFSAFISGLISIISLTAYLSLRFSVIRTMAAVSIIWIVISFFMQGYFMDSMLASSPVFLFWLYRFIRYGPSKMFKDK